MNWKKLSAAVTIGATGMLLVAFVKDAPHWAVIAVGYLLFNQVIWGNDE